MIGTPSPVGLTGKNVPSCQVCSKSWLGSGFAVQPTQFWPTFHPFEYVIMFPFLSSPSVSSIDTLRSTHNERDANERSQRITMKIMPDESNQKTVPLTPGGIGTEISTATEKQMSTPKVSMIETYKYFPAPKILVFIALHWSLASEKAECTTENISHSDRCV